MSSSRQSVEVKSGGGPGLVLSQCAGPLIRLNKKSMQSPVAEGLQGSLGVSFYPQMEAPQPGLHGPFVNDH